MDNEFGDDLNWKPAEYTAEGRLTDKFLSHIGAGIYTPECEVCDKSPQFLYQTEQGVVCCEACLLEIVNNI